MHPEFAQALPTYRTARGVHVLFRTEQHVPYELFPDDGELRGIHRSKKPVLTTIPPSLHESGAFYAFINSPPSARYPILQIDYVLAGLNQTYSPALFSSSSSLSSSTHSLSLPEILCVPKQGCLIGRRSIGEDLSPEAIAQCNLPTGKHQSNVILFNLCRCLNTIERRFGRKLTRKEELSFFGAWYTAAEATGYLRHRQSVYLGEFLGKRKNGVVRYGIDESSIHELWSVANQRPLPLCSLEYFPSNNQRHERLIVALGRELQRDAELQNKPSFFLSAKTISVLCGKEPSNTNFGARLLRTIRAAGIFELTKEAEPDLHHAAEYRYIRDMAE